jgi:hypothetical protein
MRFAGIRVTRVLVVIAGLCSLPALGQTVEGRAQLTSAEGEALRRQLTQADSGGRGRLTGFSIVMLEGDLGGNGDTAGIPAGAAKALADVRDFLPYKTYRLLDSQWVLGSGRIAVRLRGSAGQEYTLKMTTSPTGARMAQATSISILEFELSRPNGVTTSSGGHGAAGPGGPHTAAADGSSLIETSFRMNVGETVVVGTSRLAGDRALIVLLTAVGR